MYQFNQLDFQVDRNSIKTVKKLSIINKQLLYYLNNM